MNHSSLCTLYLVAEFTRLAGSSLLLSTDVRVYSGYTCCNTCCMFQKALTCANVALASWRESPGRPMDVLARVARFVLCTWLLTWRRHVLSCARVCLTWRRASGRGFPGRWDRWAPCTRLVNSPYPHLNRNSHVDTVLVRVKLSLHSPKHNQSWLRRC